MRPSSSNFLRSQGLREEENSIIEEETEEIREVQGTEETEEEKAKISRFSKTLDLERYLSSCREALLLFRNRIHQSLRLLRPRKPRMTRTDGLKRI